LGGNKLINVGAGSASTDGANFSQLGALLPAGMVLPTAGSTVPAGYLLCNGQAVSRTTYANLFAAIGTTYGVGDGLTTMNVPNLIGRVIAGIDPTGTVLSTFSINTPATPGGIGGTEGHLLSTAEMPVHQHGLNDPGHSHTYVETPQGTGAAPGASGFTVSGSVTVPTSTQQTGITMNNTGGSNTHLNVQPTMVMNYLIKT
jgi:microcystin-dependent protein